MTNEPDNSGAPRHAGENDESQRRNNEPIVLAMIGLGVAALLFVASALPVILSRGDDESSSDAMFPQVTTEPSSIAGDPANSSTPVPPSTIPGASTPAAAPGSTDTPVSTDTASTDTPVPTDAPATTEAPPATGAADEVPESVAIVLGGKIYLEGAVPNETARDQIVELATEIFTSDNVIDNYVIDPRASDPNLGNIRVDDIVLFQPDSAAISPESEPLLNQGLALLTIRPAATFVIEGHTDSLGSDDYNLQLSQERADAIVRWYTDRGIDASRLTAIGRGETEPIASDETRAGRDRNRRIEVTIENLLTDT